MPQKSFSAIRWIFLTTAGDYGELRMLTVGHLRERMMVVIWTPRGSSRHVISMRKANAREKARFGKRFEED